MTTHAGTMIDRHLAAFAAGDLDGLLGDYTDASVMITQDGTFRGREEIREFFDVLLSGLFAPGTYTFTMDAMTVEGDIIHIVWHASCASARVVMATDTFVLRDGGIAAQTYTALVDPR